MERNNINRLNVLFEKAMSNQANLLERKELNRLYQAFIDDGRDKPKATVIRHEHIKVAIG
ncbi:hypothetical protein Q4489_03980 [Thalassotalea sp. 1_MG-2023]|uniref:hypothetical protein n=1 Tax=Thalassotalea sp. 1_MG-2023 TaxID=3062680 RepID=UPI0026E2E426|nr:hypothetical protein [Thalassotalea sp. 1_MG-2023]MDO6426154.1 hypothetical protein [Thalassotalea sp. 1_MG-2023]